MLKTKTPIWSELCLKILSVHGSCAVFFNSILDDISLFLLIVRLWHQTKNILVLVWRFPNSFFWNAAVFCLFQQAGGALNSVSVRAWAHRWWHFPLQFTSGSGKANLCVAGVYCECPLTSVCMRWNILLRRSWFFQAEKEGMCVFQKRGGMAVVD